MTAPHGYICIVNSHGPQASEYVSCTNDQLIHGPFITHADK